MNDLPLSIRDRDELAQHEAAIERGLKTFIDVGLRLAAVRDKRLYRDQYGTFEEYCEQRWNFSDRRARQLIDAADMVAALPTGTIVPATESQARQLSGLTPDDAAEVMRLAHEETGGKVTAAAIAAAREVVTARCYPYREHPLTAILPWDERVVDAIAGKLDRDQREAEKAAAEAEAKQFIEERSPDIAALVGDSLRSYVEAKAVWEKRNAEKAAAIRQEKAMRAAARATELSAWGKACDGLLAALSWAASSVPPEDTDRYPAVKAFIERYEALGNHINKWKPASA